jgi:hypothetical protein
MSLAFGSRAGSNASLFQCLRNMSLYRDTDAPIEPTTEELHTFSQRRDVGKLQKRYEKVKLAGNKVDANRLRSRIWALINRLSKLQIRENRKNYFARVENLRALRLSTTTNTRIPSKAPNADNTNRTVAEKKKATLRFQRSYGGGPAINLA